MDKKVIYGLFGVAAIVGAAIAFHYATQNTSDSSEEIQ